MKAMAGVFVVTMMMLTACGSAPGEDQSRAGQAASSEEHFQTQEAALTGDCYVRIECADATLRECSGTGGQCSASGANGGKVTCNGVVSSCFAIIEQPGCTTCSSLSDGCCNPFCLRDPDCR